MTETGIEMISPDKKKRGKSRSWENDGQPDSAGNIDFEVVKGLERPRNIPDQMFSSGSCQIPLPSPWWHNPKEGMLGRLGRPRFTKVLPPAHNVTV